MDFIMGDYFGKSIKTIYVEPRISIIRYIGRYIWSKFMEKLESFMHFKPFVDIREIVKLEKWRIYLLEREISSPTYVEAFVMH